MRGTNRGTPCRAQRDRISLRTSCNLPRCDIRYDVAQPAPFAYTYVKSIMKRRIAATAVERDKKKKRNRTNDPNHFFVITPRFVITAVERCRHDRAVLIPGRRYAAFAWHSLSRRYFRYVASLKCQPLLLNNNEENARDVGKASRLPIFIVKVTPLT